MRDRSPRHVAALENACRFHEEAQGVVNLATQLRQTADGRQPILGADLGTGLLIVGQEIA
jgi:hypothetical protein